MQLAKALIRLCVCVGWSEPLLDAHTTLLEISCRSPNALMCIMSFLHHYVTIYYELLISSFLLVCVNALRPTVSNFSVMSSNILYMYTHIGKTNDTIGYLNPEQYWHASGVIGRIPKYLN